jgi:hypothetical protein
VAKGICIVVEGPCSCDRLIKAKEIPQTPMVTPSNGIIIDKMAAKLYSLGDARDSHFRRGQPKKEQVEDVTVQQQALNHGCKLLLASVVSKAKLTVRARDDTGGKA